MVSVQRGRCWCGSEREGGRSEVERWGGYSFVGVAGEKSYTEYLGVLLCLKHALLLLHNYYRRIQLFLDIFIGRKALFTCSFPVLLRAILHTLCFEATIALRHGNNSCCNKLS